MRRPIAGLIAGTLITATGSYAAAQPTPEPVLPGGTPAPIRCVWNPAELSAPYISNGILYIDQWCQDGTHIRLKVGPNRADSLVDTLSAYITERETP